MKLKLGALLLVAAVAGLAMLPGWEARAAVQELFLSQNCVNGRLDGPSAGAADRPDTWPNGWT